MDATTYEPCDGCKQMMADYERQASETTTMTGHSWCMNTVDNVLREPIEPLSFEELRREHLHLAATSTDANVIYLTEYAAARAQREQAARDRHPAGKEREDDDR